MFLFLKLFETPIADALVLGPLRTEAVVLSNETLDKIKYQYIVGYQEY